MHLPAASPLHYRRMPRLLPCGESRGSPWAASGLQLYIHLTTKGGSVRLKDATVKDITTEAFDRIVAVNLRGMVYSCKHTIPIMRQQRSGALVNISSIAALFLASDEANFITGAALPVDGGFAGAPEERVAEVAHLVTA